MNEDGLESAYVVNHLGPLILQRALGRAGVLRRVMVVGAGLMVKGRFDAQRTPKGEDFSAFRTYATTKLCFAVVMREVAARHPDLDVVVLHPGVVRTDLGARRGILGALLAWVKRRWETPEVCAERLARILARDRWSPSGDARWYFEEHEKPWPAPADDMEVRRRIVDATLTALSWKEMI
jgi:NAD(P)-dependent dehydrogenase (short-subunit alcohol dehydrogenase family)